MVPHDGPPEAPRRCYSFGLCRAAKCSISAIVPTSTVQSGRCGSPGSPSAPSAGVVTVTDVADRVREALPRREPVRGRRDHGGLISAIELRSVNAKPSGPDMWSARSALRTSSVVKCSSNSRIIPLFASTNGAGAR
jgi:hypothetical protein